MHLSLRSLPCAMAVGAVALGAPALAPQGASAAVTCTSNVYHEVMIDLTAGGEQAVIAADANGWITVNQVPCPGATVTNTNSIDVDDLSGSSTHVEIDGSTRSFAPGFDDELPGPDDDLSSEIEFYLDLGTGGDALTIDGHQAGASIVAGADGINLNASGEPFGGDVDVFVSGLERLQLNGSWVAPDWLSGQGGAGTGQPFAKQLDLSGYGGGDQLVGGDDPDIRSYMVGGGGDDVLTAGAHGAFIDGGPGADTITGGPGSDEVTYGETLGAVEVDLAIPGPQDTRGAGMDTITGVEDVLGSKYDDVIKGDGGDNVFRGQDGDDVLEGRDGTDRFHGMAGDDLLRGGAGDGTLDGGAGHDTVAYDDAPEGVSADLSTTDPQPLYANHQQRLDDFENVLGSPFADRLTGSAGANAIDGGAGADTIAGGEGADRLGGGAGIDTIDSRDSSPDSVSCGEGPDSLATDALDAVAPDCAPPPGGGGGDVPGGEVRSPGTAPVLSVAVRRQSLRRALARGLRVELTCSTACRADGRLVVTRAVARRLGLGRRPVGRLAAVDLAPGTPRAARVRLRPAARRALRRARAVWLTLRAQAVDGAGHQAAPVRSSILRRRG